MQKPYSSHGVICCAKCSLIESKGKLVTVLLGESRVKQQPPDVPCADSCCHGGITQERRWKLIAITVHGRGSLRQLAFRDRLASQLFACNLVLS